MECSRVAVMVASMAAKLVLSKVSWKVDYLEESKVAQ